MSKRESIETQIEESFLSCSICLSSFENPKALPCLHTFCEDCIRDYVTSHRRRYPDTTEFPCPVCRQDITIPPNGVNGFPYNHIFASLKDTLRSSHKPTSGKVYGRLLSVTDEERHDGRPVSTRGSKRPTTKCSARIGQYGEHASGFTNISGLAVFPSGDLVVADCGRNKVTILTSSGTPKSNFTCDGSIRDLVITRTGTLLLTVSQSGGNIMHEYTLDGRPIAKYGDSYRHENAYGIAMTSRDKVVVTGMQQGRVLIFSDRKKEVHWFGSGGDSVDQFLFPYYITVSSKDNLIVSDSGNHRIKVHQMDGKLKFCFGSQGSGQDKLFYPMGVCVDDHDNIYIADANNYRIQMYSSKGKYVATPVKNTFEYGADVKPINVCFSQNQLIVSLRGTRYAEIQIFEWDPSVYLPVKSPSLFGCCSSNKVADGGVYHAWY